MPSQVFLIRPEDVSHQAQAALDYPEYAELVDDTVPDRVRVRILHASSAGTASDDTAGRPAEAFVWLARRTADRCRVWAGELEHGAPGRLLRRPVFALVDGQTLYGQVVASEDQHVALRHHGGRTRIAATLVPGHRLSPVYDPSPATYQHIAEAHARILDRLLGTRDVTATRQVRQLLDGIAPVATHPKPSDRIIWLDPRSGHDVHCSVRHVIDFGYYRDGTQTSSGIVLGDYYWDDPSVTNAPGEPRLPVSAAAADDGAPEPVILNAGDTSDGRSPAIASRLIEPTAASSNREPVPHARFVDFMDSLENPHTGQPPNPTETEHGELLLDALGPPVSGKRTQGGDEPSDSIDAMRVMAALADNPDLLQIYARQFQSRGPARQRPRYSGVSDLIPAVDSSARERHHSFRPSVRQQEVHDLICADDHRGKSPAVFVEYSRSSRSTKFIPHPAILSRLFDFSFGVCGLSVLHFRRFDLSAQLDYAGSTQLSARNFSVKLELPTVPAEASYADLTSALGILGVYCDEFLDSRTRRLVSAAKAFAEELGDFEPWSLVEVQTLAFWFSNVCSAYRLACEHDIDQQTTTRATIRERLTLHDAELSGLLFKMSRNRAQGQPTALPRAEAHRREPATGQPTARPGRVPSKAQTRRPVPTEVGLVAPRQGGKQLCLRFISAQGCPSQSPDRCSLPFLGHFIPTTQLDPIVKAHVNEKLGGLRSDLLNI
ncbi:hypothetical protein PRNP1_004644 [Phytophthora ramorum]